MPTTITIGSWQVTFPDDALPPPIVEVAPMPHMPGSMKVGEIDFPIPLTQPYVVDGWTISPPSEPVASSSSACIVTSGGYKVTIVPPGPTPSPE